MISLHKLVIGQLGHELQHATVRMDLIVNRELLIDFLWEFSFTYNTVFTPLYVRTVCMYVILLET
jgi:hypothetical protein